MSLPITPHILVVEDDASVRDAVGEFLGVHGFRVTIVGDAEAAEAALKHGGYQAILLDVMLPGEDGLSLCRRIAARGVPILIVSALGSTVDRIVGLEIGAADYLPKPFEPRELLARLRAVLRRPGQAAEAREPNWRFEGLRFDSEAAKLVDAAGTLVPLTAGEIRLLEIFTARAGRLLSRAMLLDLLHGDEVGPFDRAIDLAVSRLRRKLVAAGASAPIETVRGAGYRFTARIERA